MILKLLTVILQKNPPEVSVISFEDPTEKLEITTTSGQSSAADFEVKEENKQPFNGRISKFALFKNIIL